jgi:hypothetical protein
MSRHWSFSLPLVSVVSFFLEKRNPFRLFWLVLLFFVASSSSQKENAADKKTGLIFFQKVAVADSFMYLSFFDGFS